MQTLSSFRALKVIVFQRKTVREKCGFIFCYFIAKLNYPHEIFMNLPNDSRAQIKLPVNYTNIASENCNSTYFSNSFYSNNFATILSWKWPFADRQTKSRRVNISADDLLLEYCGHYEVKERERENKSMENDFQPEHHAAYSNRNLVYGKVDSKWISFHVRFNLIKNETILKSN